MWGKRELRQSWDTNSVENTFKETDVSLKAFLKVFFGFSASLVFLFTTIWDQFLFKICYFVIKVALLSICFLFWHEILHSDAQKKISMRLPLNAVETKRAAGCDEESLLTGNSGEGSVAAVCEKWMLIDNFDPIAIFNYHFFEAAI